MLLGIYYGGCIVLLMRNIVFIQGSQKFETGDLMEVEVIVLF